MQRESEKLSCIVIDRRAFCGGPGAVSRSSLSVSVQSLEGTAQSRVGSVALIKQSYPFGGNNLSLFFSGSAKIALSCSRAPSYL